MTIIVIDDERTFKSDDLVLYFRASYLFVEALVCAAADTFWAPIGADIEGTHEVTEIWWDHDLGVEGGDIMDCIKVLHMLEEAELTNLADVPMYVHSQNPVGADNIVSRLSEFCANVKRVPLPELEDAPVHQEAQTL